MNMEETAREWLIGLIEAAEKEVIGEVGATAAFLAKKDKNATLFYLPDARRLIEREVDEAESEEVKRDLEKSEARVTELEESLEATEVKLEKAEQAVIDLQGPRERNP